VAGTAVFRGRALCPNIKGIARMKVSPRPLCGRIEPPGNARGEGAGNGVGSPRRHAVTLDSKYRAAAFNAILVAALAYVVVVRASDPFSRQTPREAPGTDRRHASLLASVLSCGFAFPVINVEWNSSRRLDRLLTVNLISTMRAAAAAISWNAHAALFAPAVRRGRGTALQSWSHWPLSTDHDRHILHQYAVSPYARSAHRTRPQAGDMKSVDIPNVMPKPDLMPLTGGYRKTR